MADDMRKKSTNCQKQCKAFENINAYTNDDMNCNTFTFKATKQIDAEEQISRKLQNELSKLTLSLKKADELIAVEGRTRRRSTYVSKPAVIVRNRSLSVGPKESDNLIKPPLDSPISLMPHKMNVSTPPLHKDSKILSQKFQYQGRGAQLLHMANIRIIDNSPSSKAKTPYRQVNATTAAASINESGNLNLKTLSTLALAHSKEQFRFNKQLPSPHATPSKSIMKRTIHEVTDVNDNCKSPLKKRKLVSFYDPPVSAIKEFIRFDEEVNPKRDQIYRSNSSPIDTSNKIGKYSSNSNGIIYELSDTCGSNSKPLKWNITADDGDVLSLQEKTFYKEAQLQKIIQDYTIKDLLSRYLEAGTSKKVLAKEISELLTDEVIRKDVLKELSEKYLNELLDVTVQENSRVSVFDRLSPSNLLDYITDRAKIDDSVKIQLMTKLSSIFEIDAPEMQGEMKEELYKILLKILSHEMTEKQLLYCLDVIFKKRITKI